MLIKRDREGAAPERIPQRMWREITWERNWIFRPLELKKKPHDALDYPSLANLVSHSFFGATNNFRKQ